MIRICLAYAFLLLVARGDLFKVPIGDVSLKGEESELLEEEFSEIAWANGRASTVPVPRFQEFAFVVPHLGAARGRGESYRLREAWLMIEMEEAGDRKGFLDVWNSNAQKLEIFVCEVDAAKLTKCSAEEKKNARAWHARHQLRVGARGGLWYRSFVGTERDRLSRSADFDDTFTTLSGGRALAENLALDRDLILGRDETDEEIEITTIKGITVAPIPWNEWMPEGEIVVDEIARRIPEDQFFMVVPSLKNLFSLMARVEEAGAPILESFAVGDQYRELPSRYRAQMGLDLPEVLARFLPVKKVAVTGGDPFFPTGSDVAVVLETDKVDSVFSTLKSTLTAKAKLAGAASVGEGEIVGFQNETRTFSSFLVKLDGAVVVSNSPVQIAYLREVAAGTMAALGETDEYRFFRHRYAVDSGESAYVFISDACLRRWSGPEVRIGASRRSRALAALAKVTSHHLESGILDQEFEALLGKVEMVGGRILSERYGSLGFLTPINELDLSKVSVMEKQAYERWRRGYENGWARFFDPIAIRLELKKGHEEMDMTILPLRVDSDYQEFVNLAGKAVLSGASEEAPAEALLHLAMAVDHESELFRQAGVSLIDFLPSLSINPLGWMGNSYSISLGESLAWRSNFEEEMLKELPILIRVDVESRLKLALFLTAIKAAIETSSPDLVSWETREHVGKKYVAMIGDGEEIGLEISVYYAALPTGLLVSLNEEMLQRAIEREEKMGRGKEGSVQLMAQTSPEFLAVMSQFGDSPSLEERRRQLSYLALPILNEWYQSRGAKDPVKFHEERFGITIGCPGGKGYRWNEEDLTMESVAYGHPGNERSEAEAAVFLEKFKTMTMKGSFEKGGMRVALALDEKSSFVSPVEKGKPRPADDKVISFRDLYPQTPGMVLKYETETMSGRGQEAETEKSELKIDRVTKEGEVVVVHETLRKQFGGEEVLEVYEYEIGPKGSRRRLLDEKETEEAYEYPAEFWPGQVFSLRRNETRSDDGRQVPTITDSVVKVIGWETVSGPDGKEVEALRIETDLSSLNGSHFMRATLIQWYARGLGLVRGENKGRRFQSTTKLSGVTMPGEDSDQGR